MTINYIVFQQFVCSFRFGAIVIRGRVVNFTLHVHFISSSLRVKNMHPFSTVQAKFIQLASSLASSVGCTVSTPMIMWIAEKTFSTPSHSHKTDTGPTIFGVIANKFFGKNSYFDGFIKFIAVWRFLWRGVKTVIYIFFTRKMVGFICIVLTFRNRKMPTVWDYENSIWTPTQLKIFMYAGKFKCSPNS